MNNKKPKWRHKSIREFKLSDDSVWTVDTMMEKTGWARGTCYARLVSSTDAEYVFRVLGETQTGKTYTLDDGSKWTSQALSEFLHCKRSTAGTRLSMMNGESKRILKPVNKNSDDEVMSSHKDVSKRIRERMFFDVHGHWALLNRCL